MLERLLETGAQRRKSGWGGAASVVIHSAIIVLAVVATATGEPLPKFAHEAAPVVRLEPVVERGTTGQHAHGGGRTIDLRTPVPREAAFDFPPIVDPTISGASAAFTTDTSLLSEIGGTGQRGGATLGGTGIATDATVDTPVRALDDRAPAYPETLRTAGITGEVRVQFVVDTNGRAEPSSVRVVESSHELFTRAVLASLRQSRFAPGEVAGHRVRTLVERAFRFDIAGAGR